MRVRLEHEERPDQWVVWLDKPGARLELRRYPPAVEHVARAFAVGLAAFLGVDVTEGAACRP